MNLPKKALICPLNWGLGHATRDIPIIEELIRQGFDVTIGASGNLIKVLKKEFPQLEFIDIKGYSVRYSSSRTQVFKMFLLIPRIFLWTYKEHKFIDKIIKARNIDLVFSDNRFGLWTKRAYSIFISHQLNVKFPGILGKFEPIYRKILYSQIKKFNEVWIPDFQGDINLSGKLSHVNTKLKNVFFIGPLSRFEGRALKQSLKSIDVLFLLSGPEPQRSILEKKIYDQTKNPVVGQAASKLNFTLVRGSVKPNKLSFDFPVYNLADSKMLLELIQKSKLVICRSGYSSIMDLVVLRQKAVLVPTPGQTEQEYLAKYLFNRNVFCSMPQKKFNLNDAINHAIDFPEIEFQEVNLLKQRILGLKNINC